MAHQVVLPTQQKNLDDLSDELGNLDLTTANAKQAVLQAAKISEDMVKRGYNRVARIRNGNKKNWVADFNEDTVLKKWFGKVEKKGHVKDVHNRIESACKRIEKGLKIRLRPQKRGLNAQNLGTFFDPKTFQVFPNIFSDGIDTNYMASVFIHELIHLWFTDQKLDGKKVYEEATAIDLAKREPKKARKSAENYERYCLELWEGS
jgi:hypothetical protein